MKIAYASDIHQEIGDHVHNFVVPEGTDVIVLAGDIHEIPHCLTWITETFGSEIPVVYVPGNHEYYGSVYQHANKELMEAAKQFPNIHVLLNRSVEIDGWTFIGGTCWTDFNLNGNQPIAIIDADIKDFKRITFRHPGNSFRKLKPIDTVLLNSDAKRFIFKELENRDREKCVVVTHHAPTGASIDPLFMGDKLNPCYANNWGNQIAYEGPKLWFHGHTHTKKTYECGDTIVLCNAIGYPTKERDTTLATVDV